ncbi:MAG: hypothetical protein ABS89_00185 [Thiobacillus sp. SCN 63-1177]|nr:MAG: hypothetical protein ABS89_00185 [Thiobacillus sp. SCN 63-1177]
MDLVSNPPPIPKKSIARAQRELEFISRQLLRFARMPANELLAYARKHPEDCFYTIPHPDGKGHYQCGSLAWRKVEALADHVLELDAALGRRIDWERAKAAVIDAFVQRVLREQREVNKETAEQILLDVLETLRGSLVVTEHYFPCVLFLNGGPDEFCIGPVTFTRRAKFFKDKTQALKRSVVDGVAAHIEHVNGAVEQGFPRERAATDEESRRLVRGLYARSIKTYRGYPWIATVKVTDCDKDTSRERATKAVEMALNVIRIILGSQHTKKIRLAWSRSDALRTAHMWTDASDVIRISTGASSIGPVGFVNWHTEMMRGERELAVFGSALEPMVDPIDTYHLHDRFIDAIHWFGDAATDSNYHSSIVKYVSAIERLLFGKKVEKGHKTIFANRVRGILNAFGCDEDHKAYEAALGVYSTRSALLHGAYSPRDEKALQTVHHAEELSRMCLMCSAQIYPMMLKAFDNPGPAKLEEEMERIAKEGIGLLTESLGLQQMRRSTSRMADG